MQQKNGNEMKGQEHKYNIADLFFKYRTYDQLINYYCGIVNDCYIHTLQYEVVKVISTSINFSINILLAN